MAGTVVIMAIAAFFAGIVVGALLAVAFVVRRDDRYLRLTGRAPDWLASGTRRLVGVGRRNLDAEFLRPNDGLRH